MIATLLNRHYRRPIIGSNLSYAHFRLHIKKSAASIALMRTDKQLGPVELFWLKFVQVKTFNIQQA